MSYIAYKISYVKISYVAYKIYNIYDILIKYKISFLFKISHIIYQIFYISYI